MSWRYVFLIPSKIRSLWKSNNTRFKNLVSIFRSPSSGWTLISSSLGAPPCNILYPSVRSRPWSLKNIFRASSPDNAKTRCYKSNWLRVKRDQVSHTWRMRNWKYFFPELKCFHRKSYRFVKKAHAARIGIPPRLCTPPDCEGSRRLESITKTPIASVTEEITLDGNHPEGKTVAFCDVIFRWGDVNWGEKNQFPVYNCGQ